MKRTSGGRVVLRLTFGLTSNEYVFSRRPNMDFAENLKSFSVEFKITEKDKRGL